MQIIDAANITDKEKQIVLTAVDYSKEDQMFDQSKSALRNFFVTTAVKQEYEDVNMTREGMAEEEVTGRENQKVLL